MNTTKLGRRQENTLVKYSFDRNTIKLKMTLPQELKYIRLKQQKKSIYTGNILTVADLDVPTLDFILRSNFAIVHTTQAPAPTYWYTFRTEDEMPFVHPTAITIADAEGLIAVGGFKVVSKVKV